MVLFRPFKVGDVVEAAGIHGQVIEVAAFTTVLNTVDNRRIIVPNAQMTNGVITNLSTNPTRRLDLVIGVPYDCDLPTMRQLLLDVAVADPGVLKNPAPEVGVVELSDSKIQVALRPWVKADDYGTVHFRLLESVKRAMELHRQHKDGKSIALQTS